MKTQLILPTILLFAFAVVISFGQIPNSGFENWGTSTFDCNGSGSEIYATPTGWVGGSAKACGGGYSIQKVTDNYPVGTGQYSILIKSDTAKLVDIRGIAMTGNQTGNLRPIFPITGHPTSLTGYYKFASLSDTMHIAIVLFQNGTIVTGGAFTSNTSVSNWSFFNIPLPAYTTADSAIITLAAFNNAGFPPQYGPRGNSALYIDNLNFDKQNQTINFAAIADKTFGSAPFALAASASSGLGVTYASSNVSVATISGNTLTIVGAGSSTITASQAGDATFNPATSVTQMLTVNKANQTITFGALTAKTVGNASFTLTATGGASGLPVTFASSNTTVATISGSTVTIVAVGTTNITASQPGNANYNAATDVVQVLTVNAKQNQTITFPAIADKTLGSAAFALTATASSALLVSFSTTSDKITVSGNQITLVKAGRATITASQAGDATFNAAPSVDQSFCIKPAKPTVTVSAAGESMILTSSSATGNQWFKAGTAISGATNVTLTVTEAGIYKVQVKVDDCTSEFSTEVPLVVTGGDTPNNQEFNLFPNPVKDVLYLNLPWPGSKSIQIMQSDGRVTEKLQTQEMELSVPVSQYASGQYYILINKQTGFVKGRFIKQ